MKALQHIRESRGLSRRRMAQLADIDAPTYGKAESGRLLSPAQLSRVCHACEGLGWEGVPEALLEDVSPDDCE